MKQVVSAARRPQQQGGTPGEAFTDNGVEPVVNPVLVFSQHLHHRVVRPTEDTVNVLVIWPEDVESPGIMCVTKFQLDA